MDQLEQRLRGGTILPKEYRQHGCSREQSGRGRQKADIAKLTGYFCS